MANPLIAKVEKGKPVYGTLLTSTSPHAPPVIGGLGLDFVFIDTEHIGIDRERVSWMITGVHFMDAETVEDAGDWMAFGFNLLILHADLVYLKRGLAEDLRTIRARLGQEAAPASARIHV